MSREKDLAYRLVSQATGLFIASAALVAVVAADQYKQGEPVFTFGWWATVLTCTVWTFTAYRALRTRRFARRVLAETDIKAVPNAQPR